MIEVSRTRVVELSSLSDTQTSGTDDKNFLDVRLRKLGEDFRRYPPSELRGRVQGRLVGATVRAHRGGSDGIRPASNDGRSNSRSGDGRGERSARDGNANVSEHG